MNLGVAVLWAVAVGAFFKFVITEGLARWQLATGTTLLEGAVLRLGPVVRWFFLAYLLVWSFVVGAALIAACGVAAHASLPVFDDATNGLARAAAALTQDGTLTSVAGGGDTVAALANAGVQAEFSYVSAAGGAFLEWLEGKDLPGVAVLRTA